MRLHDGQPLEAVITEKLRHPNLVAALGYATVPGRDPYNPHDETWLLLDFCDRGSLIARPALCPWCQAELCQNTSVLRLGRTLASKGTLQYACA